MCTMIIRDEDGNEHTFRCVNGFVSRVVAAVFEENHADARRVCDILNADAEKVAHDAH